MSNKVKVSIFCLAYNHENYIRKALEGFVMQETNFAFEVLINDDCSTDRTASIIREYEEKYPYIIKPIYQVENQYSQGIRIIRTHLVPRAKGEFFAWCEGDDYWIDPHKLQKQVDFLENNKEYSACAHCVKVNSIITNSEFIKPLLNEERDFSVAEVLRSAAPVTHTSSFMIRSELYKNMPNCFVAKGFGDLQFCLYATIIGKFRVFKEVMSVYNQGTVGSWTDRMSKGTQGTTYSRERLALFQRVNEYYDYKYDEEFQYAIEREEFNIYLFSGNKKMIRLPKYRKHLNAVRRSRRLSFLSKHFSWCYKLAKNLYRAVR